MKQAGRQMLRSAAVPLIQPDDVHSALERLCRNPLHVMRVARGIQSMQENDRRLLPGTRLPVTVRDDARVAGDVEVANRRLRQPRKMAGITPAIERHPMT